MLLDVLGQGPRKEAEREPFEPVTILIPGGEFLMGTTGEQINHLPNAPSLRQSVRATEHPQRKLNLPDYWIGRFPVTVGEFATFIRAGGYNISDHWTRDGWLFIILPEEDIEALRVDREPETIAKFLELQTGWTMLRDSHWYAYYNDEKPIGPFATEAEAARAGLMAWGRPDSVDTRRTH